MSHEVPLTRAEMQRGLSEEVAGIAENMLRQRPVIDAPNGRTIQIRDNAAGKGGKRSKLINWASNDYLGASNLIKQKNAARSSLRTWGTGSGAARLLSGGLAIHRRFEQRLAHFLGAEDALLCTTGYQANIAALVAIMGDPEDVIILDRLAHASIYDGARLSAGTLLRFKHNDLADLEKQLRRTTGARRRLICVESIYSMDGDEAPLAEIVKLCDQYGALLYVDEAHALGVIGKSGRGCCHELGIKPDILIGTNSKSFGSQGGFIAGDQSLIDLIINRGRSFIFSTAPAPAAIGAALESLNMLKRDSSMQASLLQKIESLRQGIANQAWQTVAGRSPIIPIIIGGEDETLALSQQLRAAGHYVPAIRPPTVPPGQCRLRVSLTLAHTQADINRLLKVLAELKPAYTHS